MCLYRRKIAHEPVTIYECFDTHTSSYCFPAAGYVLRLMLYAFYVRHTRIFDIRRTSTWLIATRKITFSVTVAYRLIRTRP